MDFKEMVGNKLKKMRKDRGYTQGTVVEVLKSENPECADIFPQDNKGWQGWEKGRTAPSLEALSKIALLFGVSADYLLDLSKEMQPQAKEFQKATGLSESSITNLSRYKSSPKIMDCINQFLSSSDFLDAMSDLVIAKTPIQPSFNTKEFINNTNEKLTQGAKLFNILTGGKRTITDEKITLTQERLTEYYYWKATQTLAKLMNKIVEGEKDNGKC